MLLRHYLERMIKSLMVLINNPKPCWCKHARFVQLYTTNLRLSKTIKQLWIYVFIDIRQIYMCHRSSSRILVFFQLVTCTWRQLTSWRQPWLSTWYAGIRNLHLSVLIFNVGRPSGWKCHACLQAPECLLNPRSKTPEKCWTGTIFARNTSPQAQTAY